MSSSSPNHLRDHIQIIAKHEEEFLAGRSASERLGDTVGSLVGSLPFLAVHCAWFVVWILINTLPFGLGHFDPAPFPLLDTLVALEAIFLASFIVMRQSRLSRRSDERAHLILQMLILAEKEVTAVLKIQHQMAQKAGVKDLGPDIVQLTQQTSIDEVAQTIKESIQTE